jgi:hypothetical protein
MPSLTGASIWVVGSPPGSTCGWLELEGGGSVDGIEHRIMVGGRSAGEADWTKAQADWLISPAVRDLCPQMQEVLKSYGPPFFISH